MSDEINNQEQRETPEHTESGFGTGLREQLARRREGREEEAPPAPRPQAPLVELEQLTTLTPPAPAAELDPELDRVKAKLAEAERRERELRAAFAEQVEAYERKLSEDFDVSRQAAKLDEKSSKLTATESQVREREQRLVDERRELNVERRRMSELQDELTAAQASAAELEEELQTRAAALAEA